MIKRLQLLAMGEFHVIGAIGRDPAATRQAAVVSVVTFTVLAIIIDRTVQAIMLGIVIGLLGLGAWSVVLWATTTLIGGKAKPVELFRAIGFVAPPIALTPIPILGVTAGIGAMALQVVAVKDICTLSTLRAAIAVIPPWIALLLFGVAVRAIAG